MAQANLSMTSGRTAAALCLVYAGGSTGLSG